MFGGASVLVHAPPVVDIEGLGTSETPRIVERKGERRRSGHGAWSGGRMRDG
jgi:hypothetical protein